MKLKILALGDIVGQNTVDFLKKKMWGIRTLLGASFVVANGENATEIKGLSASDAQALFDCGIDLLTSGNHIWGKKDIYPLLDGDRRILRPANYPASNPGVGYNILNVEGWKILCINVQGTVYLAPLDNPFEAVEKILKKEQGNYDFSLLDFHAEATSEKIAMGRSFDGRINMIWGTHTHVQTADECILPNGTGYITDLGMTGPINGILGAEANPVIEHFYTQMPKRFSVADGDIILCGALFELDTSSGKVTKIERIRI